LVSNNKIENLRKKAFKLYLILLSKRSVDFKKISPVNDRCTILSDTMSRSNSDLSFVSKGGVGSNDWNSGCESDSVYDKHMFDDVYSEFTRSTQDIEDYFV
jgi:hypothetical protein